MENELLNEITLLIETEDGEQRVTVDFDFTEFTPVDIARGLALAGSGPEEQTLSFLFLKASKQVDLDNSAWPGFRDSLLPMFRGDDSILTWEG